MNDHNLKMLPYLKERWQKTERSMAFSCTDPVELTEWRKKVTKKLRSLIGYDTFLKTELKPRITEVTEFKEYTRQRVEIRTEPGITMPLYVLIPRNIKPPYPVMIAPHGHYGGGKLSVAGCKEIPGIPKAISIYNYDYGVKFVKAGFITFCPDARGFGERHEDIAKTGLFISSCQWINFMAFPLGQTITGMWAWDIHRLVDYIYTRPDCINDNIGCGGLSGGGMQTLWATALDTRITHAIISGYFYGYKESLLELFGNCSCNTVPHLYEYVDMGDIGALIAPRPLFIESGNRDPLNGSGGLKNVYSQVKIVKNAYRLLRAEKRFKHVIFDGEHRWNGIEALEWLKKFIPKENRV
jgi:hypothetical protein